MEIFYVEHRFITFDFGDLAVVIEYDRENHANIVSVWCGADYMDEFIGYWQKQFPAGLPLHGERVDSKSFQYMKRLFKKWKTIDVSKIFNAIGMSFSKYLDLYGVP